MDSKLIKRIILGMVLVTVTLAAPHGWIPIPGMNPSVQVVPGPTQMITSHVIGAPFYHQQVALRPQPLPLPPPPPPLPPPPQLHAVYQPGEALQCICTAPSNCESTGAMQRCSKGKVSFDNVGSEVCCPTEAVIC